MSWLRIAGSSVSKSRGPIVCVLMKHIQDDLEEWEDLLSGSVSTVQVNFHYFLWETKIDCLIFFLQ